MKKLTIILVITLLFCTALAGQSLTTNEYLLRSIELDELATVAFEQGDYDAAVSYSIQAQDYSQMSDLYVAQMLLKQQAEEICEAAQSRYDWASSSEVEGALRYPNAYTSATLAIEEAKLELANGSYEKAIENAENALNQLAMMKKADIFPAYYVVESKIPLTDCLWRIAELPAVYNDPYMWKELYKANRNIMPQPNNPDLIRPGMILVIPSINNEKRAGTYQAGTDYAVFGEAEKLD